MQASSTFPSNIATIFHKIDISKCCACCSESDHRISMANSNKGIGNLNTYYIASYERSSRLQNILDKSHKD